jgi:RNAse (barnase) inhibitor barstar
VILIVHDNALPELRPDYVELAGEATSKDELFAELASALAFPEYVGRNWDAFEEYLGDRADGTDLLVRNARELWQRLPREMMVLVDVWLDQAEDSDLVFLW